MKIKNKMIDYLGKLIFFLLFSIGLNTCFITAMNKETEQAITQPSLLSLPKDIKVLIVKTITESTTFDEAIKNIKNFAVVNKEFNRLINDSKFNEFILDELTRKLMVVDRPSGIFRSFDYYKNKAALFLWTPESKKWLKDQKYKQYDFNLTLNLVIRDLNFDKHSQRRIIEKRIRELVPELVVQ